MMSVVLAAPNHHSRETQQQVYGVTCGLPPPHHQRTVSHGTKGLLNRPGQNNCFLNSAVQVLWHLDIFRRSFRDLSGHACMADSCIFCALKELFAQFQYSQDSALPPDALRRALAETFYDQQRFQLGFMDDAAECFENMLLRIHFHIANTESEDMCNAMHCIPHQKFAMTLVEQSVCHACGATSEPLPFTQMVHYISASALCVQAEQMVPNSSGILDFGKLLRKAGGMGDFRACPSSCGAKIQICRSLMNRPEIVSIGLVWDSERPTLEHIMNVFRIVGTTLKLQDLFHSVVDNRWASATTHQLVGVVTYYGKHYSTFFFHTKLRIWIYFDDATVREVGPKWEQVVEKCQRGHFQPLLLLYANPQGAPIAVDTAPQAITYVAGHRKLQRGSTERPNDIKGPLNFTSATPRRATTPNPELASDLALKDICPRRAITPNPSEVPAVGRVERKCYVGGSPLPPLPTYDEVDASRRTGGLHKPNVDTGLTAGDRKNDIYISRRAVENVLNYQKRQRQRTYSLGSGGSRNSNSSLESFDSMLLRNAHITSSKNEQDSVWVGKGDFGPEVELLRRRRDSGNWSGDRNSSSSTSSLDPCNRPSLTKRTTNGNTNLRNSVGGKPVEILSNPTYDPGYDSYSLSSNDSFPLSQSKHNQQLAQIPEVPNLKSLAPPHYQKLRPHNTVCADNCEILCCEADAYLAKSQMVEDAGDLPSAISLCNSAAAKARAAMDAPYVNPQSVMLARMKHNTCVMRARSLQRRVITRQESIGSSTSTETDEVEIRHTRQSSSDSRSRRSDGNHSRQESRELIGNHSRQGSRESRHSLKESGTHSRQGSKDGSRIEIYATLPKKGGKLMEKMRTGSIRVKDEKMLYDNYLIKREETSDYSSEWELTKKTSLHRTNSSPPVLKNPIGQVEDKAKTEMLKAPNMPGKKQHKIRRKLLMGGLIKRKNRSMPDLREHDGIQRKEAPVGEIPSNSFSDDFHHLSRDRNGYLSDANLDYGRRSSSEKCLLSKQQQHGGSQRMLMNPKMPPKPPVRTTSQLSLGSHQLSNSKSSSLNKSSPNLLTACKTTALPELKQKTLAGKTELKSLQKQNVEDKVQAKEDNCIGNNSHFLMELQLKRKEIFQKTSREESPKNQDNKCSWLHELQLKQTKLKDSNAPNRSNSSFAEKQDLRILSNNELNEPSDVTVGNCNDVSSLSVRDLAYKFEKIGHLIPNLEQKQATTSNFISKSPTEFGNRNSLDASRKSPNCVERLEALHSNSNWKADVQPKPRNVYIGDHHNPLPHPINGHCLPHDKPNGHQPIYKINGHFSHQSNGHFVHQHIQQHSVPKVSHNGHFNPPVTISKSPYHQVPSNNPSYQYVPKLQYQSTTGNTSQHMQHAVYQQVPTSSPYQHLPASTQSYPQTPSSYTQTLCNPSYQQLCNNSVYQQVPTSNGQYQQNPYLQLTNQPYQQVPAFSSQHQQMTSNVVNCDVVKKKKNVKKSVTFSDQVALVASADEDKEQHLPNPLMERVYKTVANNSNQPGSNELKPTFQWNNHNPSTSSKSVNVPTLSKVPCHLCRKKSVIPPTVYCPDCDFYMSRFKPKT